MTSRRPPAWAWVLAAWVLLVAAGAWVEATWSVPLETCLLKRISGHPCPTCGATRSVLAMLRGDWTGSLRASPILWLAALSAAGAAGYRVWRGPVAWERLERHRRPLLVAGLLALLANWVWVLKVL